MKQVIVKQSLFRAVAVLVALGVVTSLFLGSVSFTGAQPPRPTKVTTRMDQVVRKVHPHLRGRVASMRPSEDVQIIARVAAGTDVSQYFVGPALVRPFVDPLGLQAVFGTTKAGNVYKLAALPGVSFMQLPESIVDVPQPPDPDLVYTPSPEAIAQRLAEPAGGAPEAPPGEPTGWFDVLEGHKSAAAWAKGFTGEGVKVMVNDSGTDFAHPDLQDTTARITDPASPYYGWPEQFDSYSMYLYVLDNYFGTTNIADGRADYVDTSTTCTSSPCSFQPIGAAGPYNYTLTGTSVGSTYHIGSHPDKTLQNWWFGGERAAVLVVDETAAGVYDTVYVDLNDDYDFTNDKPLRKGDEIAYLDLNADTYADLSGGMIYFIADGVNPIPASDWMWGSFLAPPPTNGDLVAFALNDVFEPAGDHGTLCASAVAGQGVIDGGAPAWKPAGVGGLVQGGGKDVGLVTNGNFYMSPYVEDGFLFAALGYDGVPGTDDDVQIISNSWGNGAIDNDGWDYDSRLIAALQRYVNPNLSVLVSTGNGAPGYGTMTSPNAPTQMGIGASTQNGSTGTFDSIADLDQINYGDVMSWSNRGPGARGDVAVSVVANGAWGAGALPLNEWGDGWTAWDSWGGTSRSSPVAAGNLALVYQAYKDRTGSWPDYGMARAILMSGATNVHYDPLAMGAGSLNADRATDIANGLAGLAVTPVSWQVGDYRGAEYPGFANIIHRGGSDTQTFTLHNWTGSDITVNLSDDMLRRIDVREFDFTSKDMSLEDGAFTKPDYLIPIPDGIPADTDLMVVQVVFPFEQFDPEEDYNYNHRWRLHVMDWKDVNGDGNLWVDTNGDGVVNYGEIDDGEYIRFTYGYNSGTALQARVQRPLERSHDGVFLSLRHRSPFIDAPATTDMHFKVSFYQHMDWAWLTAPGSVTVPAGGNATFDATMSVPSDAPLGLYEGTILVDDGTDEVVVPVLVNAAADSANFTFGGTPEADTLYDNGRVWGYFDWGWRAESGDWRFFFADLPEHSTLAEGVRFGNHVLVDTQWDNVPTDIDTLIMGPTPDDSSTDDPGYYGPYTLDIIGKSPNTHMGSGKWRFQTSSGGAREIVSAPYTPGLNLIALHNVLFAGADISENVSGQVGTISANPSSIEATVRPGQGANKIKVNINSSLWLSGLVAEGFGLGGPEFYPGETVSQDNPDDPSTASYTRDLSIGHGALLEVETGNSPANDMDLFLLYDANGNGVFDWATEVIGSSTTPGDEEIVSVTFPADGDYRIAVHGWSVPAGSGTFDLTVTAVQGYNLTVTNLPPGSIEADRTYHFDVAWDTEGFEPGPYYGVVLLGPPEAPGAIAIPVTITVP